MNFNTKYIIFALFANFSSNFCMQQALTLREYYAPQQVAKELLPSIKLPASAEVYARAKLRNSGKKSYSPADVFDLLKKAKAKFNLNINLNFLLPECVICCSNLTEETVASSSEKFVCANHSERFCKECLNDPTLDKCPFCRSKKIEDCSPEELLFQAAQLGRTNLIKKLTSDQSINVNAVRFDGVTPLILAAEAGHMSVIKLLITNGANVTAIAEGCNNITALHQACQEGHTDIAAFLIDNGADVNAVRSDGFTPLMLAAENGHLTAIKILTTNGANIKAVAQGFYNTTALHQACLKNGHTDIAELLIANGANVNSKKSNGSTPLIAAAENGHLAAVKILIANGANIKAVAQGFYNATALHQACLSGHTDIAEFLIANGADVNAVQTDGTTPLIAAAHNGHLTTVQLLISNGANVNAAAQGFYNITALHQACQGGHTEIAKLLIANGANVNAAQIDGITPLILAAEKGLFEIAQLLLNKCANVNAIVSEFDNTTALHQACQNKYTDIAALLIRNGADVNAERGGHVTPLKLAQEKGLNDICEMIKISKKMRVQNNCAIL